MQLQLLQANEERFGNWALLASRVAMGELALDKERMRGSSDRQAAGDRQAGGRQRQMPCGGAGG